MEACLCIQLLVHKQLFKGLCSSIQTIFPFDPLLTASLTVCVQYAFVCLSGLTCTQVPIIH